MTVKKNEMSISEEHEHRTRLEMTVRQSQGKMYETDDRIRRCEEGVKVSVKMTNLFVNFLLKLQTSSYIFPFKSSINFSECFFN